MEKFELLYLVLKELHDEDILDKCVLIGSWCQDFYRQKFENSSQIPLATTTDADLLIPKRIKSQVNVADIMKKVRPGTDLLLFHTRLIRVQKL